MVRHTGHVMLVLDVTNEGNNAKLRPLINVYFTLVYSAAPNY